MRRIEWLGETLVLLPERAIYWENRRTLLVADVHFGKASMFRAAGVPAPTGVTAADLTRLDGLVERTGAGRIVFLGDFLHAPASREDWVMEQIRAWRSRRPGLEMLLVRGNHDAAAGDPPPELGIECAHGPVTEAPFAFQHEPGECEGAYTLAGHVHPVASMRGAAETGLRAACFWFGARCAVLPAFGGMTGGATIRPRRGDRVFVIGEGAVVEIETGGAALGAAGRGRVTA